MKTHIQIFWVTLFSLYAGFMFPVKAQQNWALKNPIPNFTLGTYLHYADSSTVFAVDYGVLNKGQNASISGNGGKFWTKITLADSARGLGNVFFVNRNVGFSFSGFTHFCKTTDGGKTWKPQSSRNYWVQFHFSDPSNGYGVNLTVTDSALFRTTDGGKNWIYIPLGMPPNSRPAEVHALSPTRCIIQKEDGFYISNNSGLSFALIPGSQLSNYNVGQSQKRISSNGNAVFIAGVNGKYLRSLDGGQTWNLDSIPAAVEDTSSRLFSIEAFNNQFLVANSTRKMFFSDDNGNTWAEKTISNKSGFVVNDVDFFNRNLGLVQTSHGLYQTTNGGNTWNLLSKGAGLFLSGQMALQGQKTVWIPGLGALAKSDDRGKSWRFVRIRPEDSLTGYKSVCFPTSNTGYILEINGKLYKTTNGGRNWRSLAVPDSLNFYLTNKLHFFNPDTGLAYSDNVLLSTTNGGLSWERRFNGPLNENNFYSFVSPGLWYRASRYENSTNTDTSAILLYSVSNGVSTLKSTLFGGSGNNQISELQFLDSLNGYITVVHNSGTTSFFYAIYKTTDGGVNWSQLYFIPSQASLTNVHFESIEKGTAVFSKNIFYGFENQEPRLISTSDGGFTWETIDTINQGGIGSPGTLLRYRHKPVLSINYNSTISVHKAWMNSPDFALAGKVVKKVNANCIVSNQEAGLENQLVVANPGGYYGSTSPTGNYAIDVDTGNYQVSQVMQSPLQNQLQDQYCPPNNGSLSVAFTGIVDTLFGNDFKNEGRFCPVLTLSLNHFLLRPCRPSHLSIEIENKGNLASDSEWVVIKFPPQLLFTSASIAHTFNSSDSTFRFKIPPIAPFESFGFTLTDSVVCLPNLVTSQVLCVRASIPNMPPCLLQSPNWDGADLEVASRCLPTSQTRFTIRNKGAAMPSTSQYQIFIDSSLVYQAPFQLAANGSMSVTLPLNAPAGFARLVVPQSANHPLSTFASAQANCATGISTNGMFPPPDESPLVDIECVTVTNAYDPNDKQVFPTGWGTAGNVEPETEFTYKIRFQNTGTDTAFKVVLVDTLDANLDIASLQIGAASHPYSFKVSGKGRPVLTWTFDNILLPDSGRNQLASNGFVNFSIRPKTGLALGTKLENFADIYFDFNDPIRTNTTVNTLWRPTLVDGVIDTVFVTEVKKSMAGKSLKISPNPAVDEIAIFLPEVNAALLEITDLQGKSVQKRTFLSGQSISIKDLKPGVYFLKMDGFRAERLVVKP